jgi:hypothetical protein
MSTGARSSFGGANKGVFDGVNFVTHAATRNPPIVAVNFKYRVDLGGFLASSTIKADLERDGFKGALDLLYLFLNFDEHMTEGQRELARTMANHFIDFAHGKDPWPRVSNGDSWMRYGQHNIHKVVTEAEDEKVRKYSRMQKIMDMGIYEEFTLARDDISGKRHRMGTFERKPDQAGYVTSDMELLDGLTSSRFWVVRLELERQLHLSSVSLINVPIRHYWLQHLSITDYQYIFEYNMLSD